MMWCANLIQYPLEKNNFEEVLQKGKERLGEIPLIAESEDGKAAGLTSTPVIKGQAVLFKAAPAAQHTLIADLGGGQVTAHDAHMVMPPVDQVVHRLFGSSHIIGGDTGQVGEGKFGGVVGYQHTGLGDFIKIRQEILPLAAQKQNTEGLLLPAKLYSPENFVFRFIHVMHNQRIAGFRDAILDAFHQEGEHLVVGTLYHNQDGIAVLLLQLLGVGIQLKAGGFCSFPNNAACVLTDIGLVIQNTGNRTDGIACQCGNVFDGHGFPPVMVRNLSAVNVSWYICSIQQFVENCN